MKTNAPSTNTLLPSQPRSGGQRQLSEQDAARQEILTALGCSLQTVTALVAILKGVMRETPSLDQFRMALCRARQIATSTGDVSPEEWERVEAVVIA